MGILELLFGRGEQHPSSNETQNVIRRVDSIQHNTTVTNDTYPTYKSLYKQNIHFVTSRYEEWTTGKCLSKGAINTVIDAEVSGNIISFTLRNSIPQGIDSAFVFSFKGDSADVLADRIQYQNDYQTGNVPFACNIFLKNQKIHYIRFGLVGPRGLRLIEFYND